MWERSDMYFQRHDRRQTNIHTDTDRHGHHDTLLAYEGRSNHCTFSNACCQTLVRYKTSQQQNTEITTHTRATDSVCCCSLYVHVIQTYVTCTLHNPSTALACLQWKQQPTHVMSCGWLFGQAVRLSHLLRNYCGHKVCSMQCSVVYNVGCLWRW